MIDKLKLLPREATREMLEAMDECSMEGYDERLYAGHAGSVYMAAWDAFHGQHCYCGDITNLGVIHRDDGPCHYPEHTSEYKRGYADAMNWKVQNHLEHLPPKQPEQEPNSTTSMSPTPPKALQPEQEPFGYFRYDLRLDAWVQNREGRPGTPFYTTPPQRTWVGLTDEEIYKAEEGAWYMDELDKIIYAKNIEAKLKEKNT